MSEFTLNILKVLFLALLHTHLWLWWAKKDYISTVKEKLKFPSKKRLLILVLPIVLTILSIMVVDYPVPDNMFARMSVDIIAIWVIIWFRWIFIPKKIENVNK